MCDGKNIDGFIRMKAPDYQQLRIFKVEVSFTNTLQLPHKMTPTSALCIAVQSSAT